MESLYFFVFFTSAILSLVTYNKAKDKVDEINTCYEYESGKKWIKTKMLIHIPAFMALMLLIGFTPFLIEMVSNLFSDNNDIKEMFLAMNPPPYQAGLAKIKSFIISLFVCFIVFTGLLYELVYYIILEKLKSKFENK